MGNIKDMAAMVPGLGKMVKDKDIDEGMFNRIDAIILSMTPEERSNPAILNSSRRNRIAAGSGTTVHDVNMLLKQFDGVRKMMQKAVNGTMPDPRNLMNLRRR